ncbi:MAG: D-tyrosyl-tRNA(Tyr) deacylase [Candidatus Lambdaproteobacteria bacterium]|nr:D-tyrosyl-tRNA(Tyr) deacylase [Candidatus Lambdaproteobacteria bacterium]
MRVLLQRVADAWVDIAGRATPPSGAGLLALVGFCDGDHEGLLAPMAEKIVNLRIFEDAQGKLNRSLLDRGGALVLVSQFTLYADLRRGRRPGFSHALAPPAASRLFDAFVACCRARVVRVETGEFGASMRVHLINDGPVTLLLDSAELGMDSPMNP